MIRRLISSVPGPRLRRYLLMRLRYLTPGKIINIIKIERQLAIRKDIINGYPYELTIGSTNICQLRCPLCFTGLDKSKHPKLIMPFSLYKKIIDEMAPYALSAYLHWQGEPLLHNEIIEFIQYAHRARIGTVLHSNMSFDLNKEKAEALINSGLDMLTVSLDGVTKEAYETYRIGGDFDIAVNNIKVLTKLRWQKKKHTPYIEWQFLVTRKNEHQIPLLSDFARELGVDAYVTEQVLLNQGHIRDEEIKEWLPQNEQFKLRQPRELLNKSDNLSAGNCWWLWRSIVIGPDGGVSPCCYNRDKAEDFGNISDEPLYKIWNNEKYIAARRLFSKANNDIQTLEIDTLCKGCGIYLSGRKK